MLAHFTSGDQFMGFSGSSVSGSAHHTTSSGGEDGVVGTVVAVGMGLLELENRSSVCEGAMVLARHQETYESSIPLLCAYCTTNEDGLLEKPRFTRASAGRVRPSSATALSPTGACRFGRQLPVRYRNIQSPDVHEQAQIRSNNRESGAEICR